MLSLLLAIIYLSFISLGLPDALLGAAWPTMYPQMGASVSWAGAVTIIISGGTILSSLNSDRLTRKLGAGKVTAISVAITAAALFGFASCRSFWQLCLWAVPYGLGAGAVDSALNNYVALHYESRHMSWLHCMWGIGAATGPSVMGFALTHGWGWPSGYRVIGVLQVALTIALFASLGLWAKPASTVTAADGTVVQAKALTLPQIFAIPGAKAVMGAFFCYCALESTAGMWASSYLTLYRGVPAEVAAGFAGMFYIGITAGRAVNGFLTMKLTDAQLITLGEGILALGVLALLLPLGQTVALAGLVLVGLGCAPIYPCTIHSTPDYFGAENSQAIIGVQMASAYLGSLTMPALFGLIANHISPALYPVYMGVILAVMFGMHQALRRRPQHGRAK